MAIFPFHKVGGSCNSGELAEVGTSEVEQLGRRGVAAEVAPGSGAGAGQRRRPALSVGLSGSATDLFRAQKTEPPLWACLLPRETEGLCLIVFEALLSCEPLCF